MSFAGIGELYALTNQGGSACCFTMPSEDLDLPTVVHKPCKCPSCGARYTTPIVKCDYCGMGENKKEGKEEKRVFYIDVGKMSEKEAGEYVRALVRKYRAYGRTKGIGSLTEPPEPPEPPKCRPIKGFW